MSALLWLAVPLAVGRAPARDDARPPRLEPSPTAIRADVVGVPRACEVRLDSEGGSRTVRLAGVGLPPAGPLRDAAAEFLRRLLDGESVRLLLVSPGDERRLPRALLFREPDGLCVNLELVRLGYAKAQLVKGLPGRTAFAYYQRRARRAAKGIWAGRGPAASRPVARQPTLVPIDGPPARVPANDPVVYVTKTGHKYHRAGCPHLRRSRVTKRLSEVAGRYEPCKRCKPPVPDRDRASTASQPHRRSKP